MSEEPLQVLVVDDEQIVLDSVRKHLRKDPYEVHTVTNAREGLDRLEQGGIGIVLTDLMMPEMDGLEFTKAALEIAPDVPVIMITGFATISTAMQAMELGAFDYVAKPFSRAELRGVVNRAAEQVRKGRTGASRNGERRGKRSSSVNLDEHVWYKRERDGHVRMGIEHPFLNTVGRLHNLQLPDVGDELRQGGLLFQLITTDMRSHSLLSPLSGTVEEINEEAVEHPAAVLQDVYGHGWLVVIAPERYDEEVKLLGR